MLTVLGLACYVSSCQPQESDFPYADYCGNLMTSHEHCGTCENACAKEDMCLQGECVADRQFALWPIPSQPLTTDHYDVHKHTVLDRATKLEWQRKVEPRRIPEFDVPKYCPSLELDGGGWRLPTRMELTTIVDFSRVLPAINTDVFPDTPNSPFKHDILYGMPWIRDLDGVAGGWEGPYLEDQIDFSEGSRDYYPPGQHDAPSDFGLDDYVRCVRGGTPPAPIDQHYEVDADTVLDLYTGLHWQRNLPMCDTANACHNPGDQFEYTNALTTADAAIAYCDKLELGGHDDYRVPSIVELISIVYPLNLTSSNFDPELFPQEAMDLTKAMWSSTRYVLDPKTGSTWVWSLNNIGEASRDVGAVRTRCVRGEW